MVWYGMYSVVVCMQCIKFYMAVGSDPWLVEDEKPSQLVSLMTVLCIPECI